MSEETQSFFPLWGAKAQREEHEDVDIEAGTGLYPGISATENMLRLGFIKKVFGIVSMQLLLTAAVALGIASSPHALNFFYSYPWVLFGLSLVSMLGLIPIYIYKDRHPINLLLLGLWTCTFGVTVGISITFYAPAIVAQAVLITACVVAGLTAYTFYATKRGVEFGWMQPLLISSLWALIVWSLIQVFWSPGPVASTIYSLIGSLIFSAYIVYDVHLLARKMDVDEYIWGSIALYLDIINLFMHILRLLGNANRRD
jgi:FtsH-binding integral membrane protein